MMVFNKESDNKGYKTSLHRFHWPANNWNTSCLCEASSLHGGFTAFTLKNGCEGCEYWWMCSGFTSMLYKSVYWVLVKLVNAVFQPCFFETKNVLPIPQELFKKRLDEFPDCPWRVSRFPLMSWGIGQGGLPVFHIRVENTNCLIFRFGFCGWHR